MWSLPHRATAPWQSLLLEAYSALLAQELTSEMKAEVRAVLQHYGVTQFKIRPVQRNYAFENPKVGHGLQWVLKVTYPATLPQLPLGLTGKTVAGSSIARSHDPSPL